MYSNKYSIVHGGCIYSYFMIFLILLFPNNTFEVDGLPTKDKTSETALRNCRLFIHIPCLMIF